MLKFSEYDQLPDGGVRGFPETTLGFMWYFVKQFKTNIAWVMVSVGTHNALATLSPLFIGKMVDHFNADTPIDWSSVAWYLLAFLVINQLLTPAFAVLGDFFLVKYFRYQFQEMVRRQMYIYMQGHSLSYFQNELAGRLANKISQAARQMRVIIEDGIWAFWGISINALVAIVMFALVDLLTALMLILWTMALMGNTAYWSPKIAVHSRETSDAGSALQGIFVDIISNIHLVKLFARSTSEDENLRHSMKRTINCGIKLGWAFIYHSICNMLIIFFGVVAVIGSSLWALYEGTATIGSVTMIIFVTTSFVRYAWWVTDVGSNLSEVFGIIDDGRRIISGMHEIKDVENAGSLQIKDGEISFHQVHFNYSSKKQVLSDFSLAIPAGQKVGLVGHSGSGKSTLFNLLLRFYDVEKGQITIDGQDIRQVSQDSLRLHMALVSQDPSLFHRSIRENIRYSRQTASDIEVEKAAQLAHADSFIAELVDRDGRQGYDAFVGERGVKLSGGQRQRIAIARVILSQSKILLLDEATSALDSVVENEIQQELEELMHDRTVIAIAHRLSTIRQMDRLVVMHEGRIVEDGKHDDLLALNGHYAQLWNMQSGGFIGGGHKRKVREAI